jgi:8-oxo-dGTP pyrophosphatase MutT (NUDIX family)
MDKENIYYLLQQMTNKERELICCEDYYKIWNTIYGVPLTKMNNEDINSRDKYNLLCKGISIYSSVDCLESSTTQQFNSSNLSPKYNKKTLVKSNELIKNTSILEQYNLKELVHNCLSQKGDDSTNLVNKMLIDGNDSNIFLFPKEGWDEPEWGFPKGRREYKEFDLNCALRELQEETGIDVNLLHQIKNIFPFEENFMGSNYKTYKHKYYLMFMNYTDSINETVFQKSEVSSISWKTIDECLNIIRPYNFEKKDLIKNVDDVLNEFFIVSSSSITTTTT